MSNQDQNAGDSIVFSQFEGLSNVVARERLKPSQLETAINVDLDDSGQIRRRRGYTKVGAAGSYHSLYSDNSGLMLVVKDGSLCRLFPDYTTTALQPGFNSDYLDYVRVADVVYFSSATSSGKYDVATNTVSAWGQIGGDGTWLSPVVNPTPTLGEVNGRLLGKPPMATSLAYYNGRIYLANKTTLWYTIPFAYDYIDKTRSFYQFEADITMVKSVTDGLYVGTEEAVYFLGGDGEPLKRQPIMAYGAIPRSAVNVPAELVKPQIENAAQYQTKNAVMFLTKSGVVAGFDSGASYNLTQAELIFPDAVRASAMFRRQDGMNQFVAVQDSSGTPGSAARLGDYVDAQIIRFNGA